MGGSKTESFKKGGGKVVTINKMFFSPILVLFVFPSRRAMILKRQCKDRGHISRPQEKATARN